MPRTAQTDSGVLMGSFQNISLGFVFSDDRVKFMCKYVIIIAK